MSSESLTSKQSDEQRPLVERLNLACVASCDCLVKTPVIHYHNPTCKYRVMQEAANALVALDECYDAFMIGAKVRTPSTLLANIQNAFRRSNCLSAIEREFFTEIVEDGEDADEACDLSWGADPDEYVEQFRAALAARGAVPPKDGLAGLVKVLDYEPYGVGYRVSLIFKTEGHAAAAVLDLDRQPSTKPARECTHRFTVDGMRNPRPEDKCDGCDKTWGEVQAALGRPVETSEREPWRCTICNNMNPDDATH